IRHHALGPWSAVDDQLVRAAEDALHGFQVDPLARHVFRLGIFFIDFQEAGALALGFGDRLLLVAFGGLEDLRGAALGLGHDAVGIGLRLVLLALEIGAGSLHV